jgi:putative ABC transport system permease protein
MFGLFGLTLFIARSRTKEIGIRKVFGCAERSIMISFLFKNALHVSMAALLSVPVTLYFIRKWLDGFAYRVDINGWFFFIAFAAASIVVLFTVSFHSFRASRTNPVNAIRYE